MPRHLVLAGAGHAQLDLLAALSRQRPAGWDVTLVTSQPAFHYSGLLPAIIAGLVPPDAAQIPVAAIARAAGMRVVEASVTALDAAQRRLQLHSGQTIDCDLLSLDVGSVPAALDVPGVSEHASPMRPFHAALTLTSRLDAALVTGAKGEPVPVVVVGAGAAGVEIAFAACARIRAASRVPQVTLLDPSITDGRPLAGFDEASRTLAARALHTRGIRLHGGEVQAVHADAVTVRDASGTTRIASVATAWVTGPAAPEWLSRAGLPCDARGYPLADDTLALTADATIFGAGDCVTLREHPDTPKAGVFAVRMAPILAANVLAVMRDRQPAARYMPQRSFLALLSTGDGKALLRWNDVTLESRWAQHLKTWIDLRYLRRYRSLSR